MAGDTRGSDTVHTRYARKGTPTAMNSGKLYADVRAWPETFAASVIFGSLRAACASECGLRGLVHRR